MRFDTWIPGRVRVGLKKLDVGLRAVRENALAEMRPVVSRRRGGLAPHSAGSGRLMEVVSVVRETDDAITLLFDNTGPEPIAHTPGQFITLVVEIEGETLRRPYSLCTDPADRDRIGVTVKRVPGGRVSNHLNDTARVGGRIRVFGPGGRFGCVPEPGAERHLVLIAGGSGITPLMSIARALCAREPRSRVELVYANQSRHSIIFHNALDELARRSPSLSVHHVLETPHEGFEGASGRLTRGLAAEVVPLSAQAEYYICGPAAMMDGIFEHLIEAGVDEARIHLERFSPPPPRRGGADGVVYPVRFERAGVTIQVASNQTLLDAGRAAGLPMEFSCAVGGCGACRVHLVSGEVEMEDPNCLTRAERDAGHCLACVGRPRGPVVIDA